VRDFSEHDLSPWLRGSEPHLLSVTSVLRAKRLDQESFDVADCPLRFGQQLFRRNSKLAESILSLQQHATEAEPRETVPFASMPITTVVPKAIPDWHVAG
jgi:hypothetical protein